MVWSQEPREAVVGGRQRGLVALAQIPRHFTGGRHERLGVVERDVAAERARPFEEVRNGPERPPGRGVGVVVEPREHLSSIVVDRLGDREPPRRSHRLGNLRDGRAFAGVRAAEQVEQVELLVVGDLARVGAGEDVDRVEEFRRREERPVEYEEVAAADEPAFVSLGPEVAFEVGRGRVEAVEAVGVDGASVRREVERDGRVGVTGPVVDADAPEAPTGGTLDRSGLVIRPAVFAVATLASAPDSHTRGREPTEKSTAER